MQHPEGKPMVATRFFCRPRDPAEPPNEPFPGVLRNAIREVAGLRHSCDTMKGSSGAPIFMERTGLLVGIQRLGGLSEDPQTFNGATPFDTILEKSDVLTGVMTTTASNSSAKEALESLELFSKGYFTNAYVYQTLGGLKQTRPFPKADAMRVFKIHITDSPVLSNLGLDRHLHLSNQAREEFDHAVKEIKSLLSDQDYMSPTRLYIELRGILPEQYDSYGTRERLFTAEELAARVESELCIALDRQFQIQAARDVGRPALIELDYLAATENCKCPPGVVSEAQGYASAHAVGPRSWTSPGLNPVSGKVEIRIFHLPSETVLPSRPIFDWVPLNDLCQ